MNVKSFADLNDIIINEDDIALAGGDGGDYYDDFEQEEGDADNEEGARSSGGVPSPSSTSDDGKRYSPAISAVKSYRYNSSPIQGDREDRFIHLPRDSADDARAHADMEESAAEDEEGASQDSDAFWAATRRANTPLNEEVLRRISAQQQSAGETQQRSVAHVFPKNINTVLPGKPPLAASRLSAVRVVPKRDRIPGLQQKLSLCTNALSFTAKEDADAPNGNLYSIIQSLVDAAARKTLEKEERAREVDRLLVEAIPVKGLPLVGAKDEPFRIKVGAGTLEVGEVEYERYRRLNEAEVGERIDGIINDERKELRRGGSSSSGGGASGSGSSEDGSDAAYAYVAPAQRRSSYAVEEQEVLRALEERRAAALERLGLDRKKLSDLSETVYASFLSDVIKVCRERSQSSGSVQELAMHKVLAHRIAAGFTGEAIEAIREDMFDAGLDALVRTAYR